MLRSPGVSLLVGGILVRSFGHSIRAVALGWYLYERWRTPWALGLVGLVQIVPVLGLMFLSGAVADRYPRRVVATLSTTLQALASLGIAAACYFGALWAVYGCLFVLGVGIAFSGPAISSLPSSLVPTERLAEMHSWVSLMWQSAQTIGPAVGGLLLASVGAWPIFLIDAVAALTLAGIVWSLPSPFAIVAPRPKTPAGILAGLRFVIRCRELFGAFTVDLCAVLLGGTSALMPIFARDVLHVGPRGLGWLLAAAPVGGVVTTFCLTRAAPWRWRRSGFVMLGAVMCFGVATFAFGLSRSLPLSLALLVLIGTFDAIAASFRRSLEQVLTPDRLRGRVAAVHNVFVGLSDELGEFESGASAALLGATGSVLLGGAGAVAVAGLAFSLSPTLRRMNTIAEMKPRDDLTAELLDVKVA